MSTLSAFCSPGSACGVPTLLAETLLRPCRCSCKMVCTEPYLITRTSAMYRSQPAVVHDQLIRCVDRYRDDGLRRPPGSSSSLSWPCLKNAAHFLTVLYDGPS